MLEFDLIDHVDCYYMSIMLLTHEEHNSYFIQGKTFCQLFCKYTSQIVDEK